jgi:hypothetical protein
LEKGLEMAELAWDEMKEGGFGTIPYCPYRYGPVSVEPREQVAAKLRRTTDELSRLKLILELLKKGDFSATEPLVPLLASMSQNVRLYAAGLFADVCRPDQVKHLEKTFWAAEDANEVFPLILALGMTFSLQAIPLLWQIRKELGDQPDLDGLTHVALTAILSLDGIDEYSLDSSDATEACDHEVMGLDATKCYFEGRPIHPGDFTKQVITYAVIANREGTGAMLGYQPKVLSNFSGINCPIQHDMTVTDAVFRGVLDYTKRLASMKWNRGTKYFYAHPIGS